MIIKNSIIPFGGYKVINLFGIIFTKSELSEQDKNHENIHTRLMIECFLLWLIILPFSFKWLSLFAFYIHYGLEYLIIRLKRFGDKLNTCYHDVSFEEEAYNNEDNLEYLKTRKLFQWLKYIKIRSN